MTPLLSPWRLFHPLFFSFDFRPPFSAVVWLAFSPLSAVLLVSGLCVGARVNRPGLLIGLPVPGASIVVRFFPVFVLWCCVCDLAFGGCCLCLPLLFCACLLFVWGCFGLACFLLAASPRPARPLVWLCPTPCCGCCSGAFLVVALGDPEPSLHTVRAACAHLLGPCCFLLSCPLLSSLAPSPSCCCWPPLAFSLLVPVHTKLSWPQQSLSGRCHWGAQFCRP